MKEFTTQISTTREQSERLLALGLNPETADLMWDAITVFRGKEVEEPRWSLRTWYYPHKSGFLRDDEEQTFIPSWSLHRLLIMCDSDVQTDGHYFSLPHYGFTEHDNIFDNICDCIEWLIQEGKFNKEYLV